VKDLKNTDVNLFTMYKKTLLISAFLLAALSMGAAVENYDGPSDQPHIMEQPGNDTPGEMPNGTGLPQQASNNAVQALNAISEAFNQGLNNIGESLGQSLRNILGN